MITADSFPTPHLALRTNNAAKRADVHAFACLQAAVAEHMRVRLADEFERAGHDHAARIAYLHDLYADLIRWRWELEFDRARTGGDTVRPGYLLPADHGRYRLSLRAGGPNYDRIGAFGRLRDAAVWSPATRTFDGGLSTPASEIMEHYGEQAERRFAAEAPRADELVTTVTLPGGATLPGNRIVRGAAAREVAEHLYARIRARRADTGQVETGGDPMYCVTADPDHADRMFTAALDLLAQAYLDHPDKALRAWQWARFLLYQSPRTKKGSDAVIRTFLVVVGAVVFGVPPVMERDADLRCMVLGQFHATDMFEDHRLLP
ncbi:hypothetical protein GCM10022243_48640 [Saccharothrix violaceirubra]|uniref:Uncharacterized protein n=1 Tax=Saccharothrix violaceirubra TaxID=413306 RepID=A0A7W7SZK1_9PSEU|nr:hypothetical protein [Saccharothrix violaceirubra]MBB4963794.1 hypothetical protein [Saccharothrix violaceirubra]